MYLVLYVLLRPEAELVSITRGICFFLLVLIVRMEFEFYLTTWVE